MDDTLALQEFEDENFNNQFIRLSMTADSTKSPKRYPRPLISDLLDARSAHGAYNLVRIADDEWKTAFRTRYGLYEFFVTHYGLTDGLASFQRFMNEVFKDILDVCMVVYLDGTLIYSDNPDKHLKHVREGFATPSCKQPIRQS
jgi:hypothetical protein